MNENILDLLENTAKKYPKKIVFADAETSITYEEFVQKSKAIGSKLVKYNVLNKPVPVFARRGIECLVLMFSVIYAGGHYVVLDVDSPYERLSKILEVSQPETILYEDCLNEQIEKFNVKNKVSDVLESTNLSLVDDVRKDINPETVLYLLFTSGSTGTPKGTIITHKNVLSYIHWFTTCFNITSDTVFGSQTPFYFSMSVSDIFGTIATGATFNVIPKSYFTFPMQLITYLNDRKVNTIYWVPSAYQIVASFDLFAYVKPLYLTTCLFAGEVMITKYLNYWMDHLPGVQFANLFGPTETTDICAYWKANRRLDNSEVVPIGKPCEGIDVFLLDKENKVANRGEMYVVGDFVSRGYLNNEEANKKAFVKNPLNENQMAYKTNDICTYNDKGELIFMSRGDFQIKHMGYRIELGEIEAGIVSEEKISTAAVIYDKNEDAIVLVYVGRLKPEEIMEIMKKKVPYYMQPNKVIKLRQMFYNQNGKIDRNYLLANYKTF